MTILNKLQKAKVALYTEQPFFANLLYRLTLEESGSPTYPRLMYLDAPENWYTSYLWPGLAAWIDRSPVRVEVHTLPGQAWVQWMSEILRRIL